MPEKRWGKPRRRLVSDVGTWKKRGLLGRARGNARALLRGRDGDAGEEQIKISVAPCEPEAKPERALPPSARPRAKKARGAEMVLTENPARACERGSGKRGGLTRRRQMRLFTRARKSRTTKRRCQPGARATRTDRRESIPGTTRAHSPSHLVRRRACDAARRRSGGALRARSRCSFPSAAIDLNAPRRSSRPRRESRGFRRRRETCCRECGDTECR